MYSNQSHEIGKKLPDTIRDAIGRNDNVSIMTDQDLITCNTTRNKWKIICTMPVSVVIRDNIKLQTKTILVVIFIVVTIMFIGVLECRKMNLMANGIVGTLSQQATEDRMTGLLNKTSFQTSVEHRIAILPDYMTCLFIMIDIDNFKQINDRLGHMAGDHAIKRFSDILSEVFGTGFITGRLGGDEFAVFAVFNTTNDNELKEHIKPYLEKVRSLFRLRFSEEIEQCDISFSAGIVSVRNSETHFERIYSRADELLYFSKHNGKNIDTYGNMSNENPE
jgi:diguanylate cyclase (GGDEF)-like protein